MKYTFRAIDESDVLERFGLSVDEYFAVVNRFLEGDGHHDRLEVIRHFLLHRLESRVMVLAAGVRPTVVEFPAPKERDEIAETIAEVMGASDAVTLCEKCHAQKRALPHECPYLIEIDGDYGVLCTCCDSCRGECSADV